MKKKYLFCEGEKNSLDIQLLSKLPINPSMVEIVPMGGKFSAGAFSKGFAAALDGDADYVYLLFRDRDFDAPVPPNKPQLTKSPFLKNTYMGYRATIENYLIDADCLLKYLENRDLTTKSELFTQEDMIKVMREIADSLKYYTAARYSIGKIRESFEFERKTTWTKGSGKLPTLFDEDTCRQDASRFLQTIKDNLIKYANTFDTVLFEQTYRETYALFDAKFMKDADYLVWFHGKDFMAALMQWFENKRVNFNKEGYYKFALKHFDYTQFPDLVELLDLLNNPIS